MKENLYATPGARVGGARAIARELRRVVADAQRLLASVRITLDAAEAADSAPLDHAETQLAELLRERLGPALVGFEAVAASLTAVAPAAAVARIHTAAQSIVDALKERLLESSALIETFQESWRNAGPRAELPVIAALEAIRSEHVAPALAAVGRLEHGWDRSPMTRISPADVARAKVFTRLRQHDEDLPELARCLERMKAERAPHRTDAQARLAEARIGMLTIYLEEQAPAFLAFLTAFVTSDEHSPHGLRLSREAARERFSPLRKPEAEQR